MTVVDTDGRRRCTTPFAPSPTSSRRTCSRRRSSSGTSSTTTTTARAPCARSSQLGAREAIMTAPDGCWAQVTRRRRAAAATARESSRASPSRRSARATPSSPATSRRATAARPPGTACASVSPAVPSRPSASAPGCSTRATSSGCSHHAEVELVTFDGSPPRRLFADGAGSLRPASPAGMLEPVVRRVLHRASKRWR